MSLINQLETGNLIIRPFSMNDLQSVHNILDIELEDANFGTEGKQTIKMRERWLQWTILGYEQLQNLNQPPYGDLAITHKTTNEIIGVCGFVPCLDRFEQLCDLDQDSPLAKPTLSTPEFGLFYAIAKKFQGQGFATEAASAMASYAFKYLHVKRIIATASFDNKASIGVMRNLGMKLKKNPLPSPAWLQVVGFLYNPAHETR